MSDRMSSVSKSSNFYLKSQQYIAKQDGQMAAVRKAMIAAGLDLDLVLADASDVMEVAAGVDVEGGMDVDVDVCSTPVVKGMSHSRMRQYCGCWSLL